MDIVLAGAALEQAAHHHEEDGNEDDGQRGARQNAAHHAGANHPLAGRARAGGQGQRQHAQRKRHGRHHNRTKAQVRCGQRRLDQALALGLQVFGKLDDQNRVFGRQANDGDQPDLEVHVVGVAAQQRGQQHTQDTQRHHQHHGQGNRPALVQRGQAQKHRQNCKAVQNERLRTGQLFFA